MVIITSIDQQAFHQLLSADTASEIAVGEEVEWFADVAETMIGTVGLAKKDNGWNYAILKRNARSDFEVSERHGHFFTEHSAKVVLLRQMAGAEVLGVERLVA